jgi:hypothetical protein
MVEEQQVVRVQGVVVSLESFQPLPLPILSLPLLVVEEDPDLTGVVSVVEVAIPVVSQDQEPKHKVVEVHRLLVV